MLWLVQRGELAYNVPEVRIKGVEITGRPGAVVLSCPLKNGNRLYEQLQEDGKPDVVEAFDKAIDRIESESMRQMLEEKERR